VPYKFKIPNSRGFQDVPIFSPQLVPDDYGTPSFIKDVILHSFIVRVAYNDHHTEEFRTIFEDGLVELDIDQARLDQLTTTVAFGPKLDQFRDWLFIGQKIGNTISVEQDYVVSSALPNNTILLVDAGAGNVSINLDGMFNSNTITVKKVDTTNNAVLFNVQIDGESNPSIVTPYESFTIVKKSGSYFLI